MISEDTEYTLFFHNEEDHPFHAIIPPLYTSVNYGGHEPEEVARSLANEFDFPLYTRGHNPTVAVLRSKLAALEGAEDCLIFSSGSAAMAATVMSYVQAGDHVLCVSEAYSWTKRLIRDFLPRFGVEYTLADGRNTDEFLSHLKPNTRLTVLESPTSLFFRIQDIRAISAACHEKGIAVVVDNSFCTPLGQNPLALGADAVVHSVTKYLNGHGDVVAGAVCATKERIRRIFYGPFMTLGASPSAWDAWLVLRGLRTLPLRFQKSCDNLLKVLAAIKPHPALKKIYHPWWDDDVTQALARSQMRQPGGMFSLEFECKDRARLMEAFRRLKRFKIAVSWGGFESLALPFALFSPEAGIPMNVARFYCGPDDAGKLTEDIVNLLNYLT